MGMFGQFLDDQADRYQAATQLYTGSTKSATPLYSKVPIAPSLPAHLATELKPGGDPYRKVKVLFEYASERINSLQRRTTAPSSGGGFFFASNDSLLATLRSSSKETRANFAEQLDDFASLPKEVQEVVRSGSYEERFCKRFNERRFVAHSEEVLPMHFYEFVVIVADGAVRLGWRWATSDLEDAPPFGPAWLYETLSAEGENPQEKLNTRANQIRSWCDQQRAQQHNLLDGFGNDLSSLDAQLRRVLAEWSTGEEPKPEDFLPYAGKPHSVHQAKLDDEHRRQLLVEVSPGDRGEPAALVLRWAWMDKL